MNKMYYFMRRESAEHMYRMQQRIDGTMYMLYSDMTIKCKDDRFVVIKDRYGKPDRTLSMATFVRIIEDFDGVMITTPIARTDFSQCYGGLGRSSKY